MAEYVSSGQTLGKVVTIGPNSEAASAITGSLAASGDNALALASDEIALTQTLLVGPHQHLIGGGGTLAMRGAESGLEITFRNNGTAATLRGKNPLADVVSMASGSEITSVTMIGGVAGTPKTCFVSASGSWIGGSFTQNPGSALNINGAVLDGASFQTRGMPQAASALP